MKDIFDVKKFEEEYQIQIPRPNLILPKTEYRAMKDGIIQIFATKTEALKFSSLIESYVCNEAEAKESAKLLSIWWKDFGLALNKARQEYYNLPENIIQEMDNTAWNIGYDNSIEEEKENIFFELYKLYLKITG